MNICSAAADLLWSRVLKVFPDIRIALSEGGTGWIPYFLDRIDRTYDMHRGWTGQDFGDKLPSEVFRQHFLTCFISDPIGIELRHHIGMDNIAWECDTPTRIRPGPMPPKSWLGWRSTFLTMRSTRSPGKTPAVGSRSTRSSTAPGSRARWRHFGPSPRPRRVHPLLRYRRIERSGKGEDLARIAAEATA